MIIPGLRLCSMDYIESGSAVVVLKQVKYLFALIIKDM